MKEFDLQQLHSYDPEYLINLGFDYTDFIVLSNLKVLVKKPDVPWFSLNTERFDEITQWLSAKYPLIKFTYDQ